MTLAFLALLAYNVVTGVNKECVCPAPRNYLGVQYKSTTPRTDRILAKAQNLITITRNQGCKAFTDVIKTIGKEQFMAALQSKDQCKNVADQIAAMKSRFMDEPSRQVLLAFEDLWKEVSVSVCTQNDLNKEEVWNVFNELITSICS